MPMVTKFNRVVTYREELPPIKSHDPLITCLRNLPFSHQTWQSGDLPKAASTHKTRDPLTKWSYEIT